MLIHFLGVLDVKYRGGILWVYGVKNIYIYRKYIELQRKNDARIGEGEYLKRFRG